MPGEAAMIYDDPPNEGLDLRLRTRNPEVYGLPTTSPRGHQAYAECPTCRRTALVKVRRRPEGVPDVETWWDSADGRTLTPHPCEPIPHGNYRRKVLTWGLRGLTFEEVD